LSFFLHFVTVVKDYQHSRPKLKTRTAFRTNYGQLDRCLRNPDSSGSVGCRFALVVLIRFYFEVKVINKNKHYENIFWASPPLIEAAVTLSAHTAQRPYSQAGIRCNR